MAKIHLGVLGSGAGSNMQSIVDAIGAGTLDAEIKLVLADVQDAKILSRAKRHGIPCRYLDCAPWKTKLEGLALTVSANTTDGKKLYGAVSVTDLLAAIEAQRGVKIERGQFSLEESLREVGEYEAKIDLGHGVFAKCRIEILDEAAPAE